MSHSREDENVRLVVIDERSAEDQVEAGAPFCICSIFQGIPGKAGSLCEAGRVALAERGRTLESS